MFYFECVSGSPKVWPLADMLISAVARAPCARCRWSCARVCAWRHSMHLFKLSVARSSAHSNREFECLNCILFVANSLLQQLKANFVARRQLAALWGF